MQIKNPETVDRLLSQSWTWHIDQDAYPGHLVHPHDPDHTYDAVTDTFHR